MEISGEGDGGGWDPRNVIVAGIDDDILIAREPKKTETPFRPVGCLAQVKAFFGQLVPKKSL